MIEIDSDPKVSVRSLVSYGVGVWVSINKQPTVKLYHSETLEHVQDISVALPISKMQNGEPAFFTRIPQRFENSPIGFLSVKKIFLSEFLGV